MNLFVEFAAWLGGLLTPRAWRQDEGPPVMTIDLMTILPTDIVKVAKTQLGIVETSKNHGEGIEKYWAATNYPDGYKNREPYCAAALCWIIREAMAASTKTWTFKRPKTASAFGFEEWSLAQDKSTNTKMKPHGDIEPGDLVIFKFSHIGIATSRPNKDGHFSTIEANTGPNGERDGDGVWQKTRHMDQVRSRIRFTV
jgi:hypothetical protein